MSQVLVLWDVVDTGSDTKLIVDLFKSFDYAWGIVAVFSILFGLLTLGFGVGEWIPDSILGKCPFFKSRLIIKKNLVTRIFIVKENDVEFEDRVYSLLWLFQHDMEKDIVYMIGNVSTTFGLSVTLITIVYSLYFGYPFDIIHDTKDLLYIAGHTVAFLFILPVIILSCLALRLHIVLSFGLRILFDAVLSVLAIFAVWMLYMFFTGDDEEELDNSKTCYNVLLEKLCCKLCHKYKRFNVLWEKLCCKLCHKRDVAPEDDLAQPAHFQTEQIFFGIEAQLAN